MKKLLLLASALVVTLFFTSCEEGDIKVSQAANSDVVSITLSLDQSSATSFNRTATKTVNLDSIINAATNGQFSSITIDSVSIRTAKLVFVAPNDSNNLANISSLNLQFQNGTNPLNLVTSPVIINDAYATELDITSNVNTTTDLKSAGLLSSGSSILTTLADFNLRRPFTKANQISLELTFRIKITGSTN